MSFKCCQRFAYYIETLSYRDTLYFLYLSLCLRFGLYISYLCDLCCHIIFIFITINHIISVIQTNLIFKHVCQKFKLRILLTFFLNFYQFQPSIAYNSVANKKGMYLKLIIEAHLRVGFSSYCLTWATLCI